MPQSSLNMTLDPRLENCLPESLHPVSRCILEIWLSGEIPTAEFRRLFQMPNLRYLSVSACLVETRELINAATNGKT